MASAALSDQRRTQLSDPITRQAPISSQGLSGPAHAAQHAYPGHPGTGGGGTVIAAHAAPRAAGNGEPTGNGAAQDETWWRQQAQEKSEGDKFLEASENLRHVREKQDEAELRKLNGQSILFELRKPKDILRQVIAPAYAIDDVPAPISYLAYHYGQATGYDHSGILVACVVAASSVINDGIQLEVRPGSIWYESARLWGLLVGPPSTGKTPCINSASGHIKLLHAEAVRQWQLENKDKEKNEPRDPKPEIGRAHV